MASGRSWNFNTGNTKIYILKTDYSGNEIESKAYGDSGEFFAPQNMEYTTDSSIMMMVAKASYLTDTTWFMLVKVNTDGDTLWTKLYSSGLKKTNSRKVTVTSDGGFLMLGWTGDAQNQPGQMYAIKTDSLGNVQWDKQYGDTAKFDNGTCALQLDDGGYFFMAWTALGNTYNRDILLVRTDSAGNELWQQIYGVNGVFDNGERIRKTKDGNYLIAGTKCLGPAVNGSPKAYLIKIDSVGSIIWNRYYGSHPSHELYEFFELEDSSIVSGGTSRTLDMPNTHGGILLKTSSVGDSIWLRTYYYDTLQSGNSDYMWSMINTSDDGFLLAGQTNPGSTGTQDAWLLKVDSVGCAYAGCIPVSILEPYVADKKQNVILFPNPTISYSNIILPFSLNHQLCDMSIIDIKGRVVLSESFLPENNNFIFPLRTNELIQGIYVVKIKSYNSEFSAKLVKH